MYRIVIFLVFIIISISGLGYWYYQDTQDRLGTLRENNSRLEVAVETTNETIDNMVEQSQLNQERITELSENLRNAEQYNNELRRIFQEHNLTLLAEEKPELIERRINQSTKEVFDNISSITQEDQQMDFVE